MQPLIEVQHLTKRYAGVTAVDDISFTVGKGEIVGFLGPNGAGKSTTMRILSGFIPATQGRVSVAGYDVFRHSVEARRRIGYMPENNPLYIEMRVMEYLKYRAALKGVPRAQRRASVDRVIELCGLTEVRRKLIGHLSKGYRQRVGIADALVHDPELVILDEPTIGLDPHQIRQVREVIRDLGKNHTVLISTHILPEVEMTCTRVLIIHRGRIAASNTVHDLRRGAGVLRCELRASREEIEAKLRALDGVGRVSVEKGEDGYWVCEVEPRGDGDLREALYQKAAEQRWGLRELTLRRTSLEEIFVELTTREEQEEKGVAEA